MKKVIVVAEAGVNHNGDLELAKKLIETASTSGADYVKFQTFKAKNTVSVNAELAKYQQNKGSESQFELLSKLELSEEGHWELSKFCQKKQIGFLSTAFDIDSLYFLKDLGIGLMKIPSGEITNLPYLRTAGKLFKNHIISTGMSTKDEIQDCLDVLLSSGVKYENITILHCNTDYPTKMEDVNLYAMKDIEKTFNTKVGLSDHSLGIEVPITAVGLGAVFIEKHFTLDKSLIGPDHSASIEPEGLKLMINGIRNISKAISGSGFKVPTLSEMKNRDLVRRSIHINKEVNKGSILESQDLIMLRPGNGISPMQFDRIVGSKVNKDLKIGHQLKLDDLI